MIRDGVAARRGLALVAAGCGVDTFSSVVFSFIGLGAQTFALPLAWAVASGLVATGFVQLALSNEKSELLWAAASLVLVNALLDFATLVLLRTDNVTWVSSPAMSLVSNAGLFVSVVERAVVAWALVQLVSARHTSALLLASVTFGAVLIRTAYMAALSWGLVSTDFVFAQLLISMTAISAVSALALAIVVRSSIGDARVAAVPTPEPERPSPASDFFIGGAILLIGIAVTTISVSTASNGGRYIVATGAIVVGLARIIRGFFRR